MRDVFSLAASVCVGIVLAGLTCQVQAAPGKVTVSRTDAAVVLENGDLGLVIGTAEGYPRVSRLVNKLSGRTIPVASDDFAPTPGGAAAASIG